MSDDRRRLLLLNARLALLDAIPGRNADDTARRAEVAAEIAALQLKIGEQIDIPTRSDID